MPGSEMTNFWLARNKLLWSRVQTALIIEGATLAGWYKVWSDDHSNLAVAILLLGAGLLIAVSLLLRLDSQYLEACERVAGEQIPQPGRPLLRLKGRQIAIVVPLLLAIFNIFLIFPF